MIDAAKVKLLNDRIFNYSRFVDEGSFGIVDIFSAAEVWDEIHKSAQSLVFRREIPDIFFADFQDRIQRYKERDVSPWIEKLE